MLGEDLIWWLTDWLHGEIELGVFFSNSNFNCDNRVSKPELKWANQLSDNLLIQSIESIVKKLEAMHEKKRSRDRRRKMLELQQQTAKNYEHRNVDGLSNLGFVQYGRTWTNDVEVTNNNEKQIDKLRMPYNKLYK